MAKTAFDHSQQASAIDLMPPTDRRRARAAEHPPRRLSPTAGNWGFRDASAKVSPPSISLMTAVNSEGMVDTSYGRLTGRD